MMEVLTTMIIGDRLRLLREHKKLSQGEIEKRTGLLRCYISRVENGHTVPAVETLEKFARALEVPLYQLFYEAKSCPSWRICRSEGTERLSRGAIRARTRARWKSFGACSAEPKRATGGCSSSWRKKW